ncbi:MAG TPA: TlpA disulfide reductase family protein [Candidatus Polarisedimenticolia bacterium]|nr:TlpA disulfide reductase family protein [Candidatus Polarisedimenticolia bacterium]
MEADRIHTGAAAPPFTLPLAGGGSLAVPDPSGRPVLLAFYKDTCPTCRFTLPFVQRLHERAAPAAMVAAVSQDGPESARAYAAELGLTLPVAVDGPRFPVSDAYGLVAVPTLVLIRPDGSVARASLGFQRDELAAMAADLERMAGLTGVPLYREGEHVPAFRPG